VTTTNDIEWLFEDSEATHNGEIGITELGSMSLAEELSEIAVPLTHPIGAVSIQILGACAGYDYLIQAATQTGERSIEENADRCLCSSILLLILFSYLCLRFRMPTYALWLPILIVALTTWLAIEWSLFS
jgi:hypothetical protein